MGRTRRRQPQKRYYDPGAHPRSANPLKSAGAARSARTPHSDADYERLQRAREKRHRKLAKHITNTKSADNDE